ncbi:hypothetical protein ACTJIJ_02050 [Niabella sp. 22666]
MKISDAIITAISSLRHPEKRRGRHVNHPILSIAAVTEKLN